MSLIQSFRFNRLSFQVESTSIEALEAFRLMYAPMIVETLAKPDETFYLAGPPYRLRSGDRELSHADDLPSFLFMAEQTLDNLLFPGAAPWPLHAAAIATKDHGVLFIGPTGAGKSHMALAAFRREEPVLADELVVLHPDGRLEGIPKTASLKIKPLEITSRELAFAYAGREWKKWYLVHPLARIQPFLHRIVALEFSPGASFEVTPLSEDRKAKLLLSALVGPPQVTIDALLASKSHWRDVQAFAVRYGSGDDVLDWLDDLPNPKNLLTPVGLNA